MADAENIKKLEERVTRLESAIAEPNLRFGPIVDPAGPWSGGGGGYRPVHGPIGDPAPIDVSRFSVAQLHSSLHSISAEKARLTAMEQLINEHLKKTK
jgi:hypothetical protein